MISIVMANALWQGAIVYALAALALRLVPPANATTRYAMWFAGLIAVVAVPALTTGSHLGVQLLAMLPHRAAAAGVFSLLPLGTAARPVPAWSSLQAALANPGLTTAIAVFWIAGSCAGIARLTLSFLRIAQIRREAVPYAGVDGVPVLTSTDLSIPIAAGVLSPAIVLPADLAGTLGPDDLRCTIEHELAHVRRGDVAGNALQRIAEALFFWNPWVYAIGRQLAREREAACDDWAVRRTGTARAYAVCLAQLGRRLSAKHAPALAPGALTTRNALVARIERLMSERSPRDLQMNYAALAAIAAMFAALTLVLAIALPPAARAAGGGVPATSSALASACKTPNAEPQVLDPVPPVLPKSEWPSSSVSAVVAVSIASDGKPAAVRVYESSGNADVDDAVLSAARKSTYSPKLVDCVPVAGDYLFKANFGR
ncbi:MAG TPA: M56 family metallopeptidase [Candidatus Acidoferrales bacterium]|nr:M56 family metallopeptidase [Candidatus Acidoferrales bacterium]